MQLKWWSQAKWLEIGRSVKLMFVVAAVRSECGKRAAFSKGGFIAVFSTAADSGELRRGSVGQCWVGLMMVVIMSPQRQFALGVNQVD
jgi:hypothetical protein